LIRVQKLRISEAARIIKKDKGSVSRELRRNSVKGEYNPSEAAEQYAKRKRSCGAKRKLIEGTKAYECVVSGLLQDWSPDQIVNVLKPKVSVSTIYRGFHNKTLVRYQQHFRQLTYKRGWKKGRKRESPFKDCRTIRERPKEVAKRKEFGHWELDTLHFSRKADKYAAVFVERKSRLPKLVLLDDLKSETMRDAVVNSFKELPVQARKTLTLDRGTEFLLWQEIEAKLPETMIYFCDPVRPWQKGTVENTNGLLRQYYPKCKHTPAPTAAELAIVEARLNNRPRKCLNYSTPQKLFEDFIKKCCT